ncbi:MAG: alpha/beta hydrolase-fold protein [Proteobacteria bacterium]|nr:alpha/beta hydrolase-fold protein [Pseudomonadota bacterium]
MSTAQPATYQVTEDALQVEAEPASRTADAAVIWLHGLGADGHDFVSLLPELRLPASMAVRFVFPHAPVRPVTVNNGWPMRAWYDIKSLDANGRDDAEGIAASAQRLATLIAAEQARGIASQRIVLAGFSQGGAVALYAGLRHSQRLAGILALSTYLPLRAQLSAELSAANSQVPILMCHGTHDPVVTLPFALQSRTALQQAGCALDWREYPMEHSLCASEVLAVSQWLQLRLG